MLGKLDRFYCPGEWIKPGDAEDKEHITQRQNTNTILLTLPLLINRALGTPINTIEPLPICEKGIMMTTPTM